MISVTDLRKGTVFLIGQKPYAVLEYKHIKLARGSATIKVKVKNLLTKTIKEESYKSGERVEEADIEKRLFPFMYRDKSQAHFLNTQTNEKISVDLDLIGEKSAFLTKDMECLITLFSNDPINIELPKKVECQISYTEPGFAGNSSGNPLKDAILKNGAKVKVPLFIKSDQTIIVDTETGEYVSRA